jgi:hypothetical protein
MFNRIIFGDTRQKQGVFCLEMEFGLSYGENMIYYEVMYLFTLIVLC